MRLHANLLFAIVALAAISCSSSSTPSSPNPVPQPNSTITYTVIAASDGSGIGSSAECVPFTDCPNGKGYVQVAVRSLQSQGFTVKLTNLSIPTATVGRDFQDLGNQYGHLVLGNFIQNEVPFAPAEATLITIFGGANDVNVVTGALGGGAGAGDQLAFINAQVRAFASDYATLLSGLRSRAPSARIVALNLPNMAGMPFLSGASLQQRQAAQKLSVGMTTTVINPLASQNVIVIDMMCDPRSYQISTYSGDGFHPNDTGYAWMAAEVVSAATTSYKTPTTSCAQMTVVPAI